MLYKMVTFSAFITGFTAVSARNGDFAYSDSDLNDTRHIEKSRGHEPLDFWRHFAE
jgi:hypothetical protein